jgi:glycosyltransferase involved in cell wall biosynthesis
MEAIKPDLVQTWMYHADLVGGLAARLAGVRAVVWGIRNSDLEKGSSKTTTIVLTRILAWLSRWIPTYIAVCARKARDVHTELGYCSDKMRVIPNGYDLKLFQPDLPAGLRVRETLALDPDIPLLGSVGRYDPQKDYANLLKALVRLREQGHIFHCILVGSGLDQRNTDLISLARSMDLGTCVQLLGRRKDIPGVMNALDIHVLPSAYGEAFPNVVNEAMACGTPCVTTDVGDAAYIVGDTGWVVPRRDSVALASGLASAMRELQTPAWGARREACRTRIETEFSMERMIGGYDGLWREAIGSD